MKHPHSISAVAKVHVRFSECDPYGLVWHGNYIKYFEDGREAFSKKFHFSYSDFYKHGYTAPLVHMKCDFKRPAVYQDVLLVETIFVKTEAAKILFEYIITKEKTGEIICTGGSTQVFVENKTLKLSLTVPDVYSAWKKKMDI